MLPTRFATLLAWFALPLLAGCTAGASATDARSLVEQLAQAEKSVPKDRLDRIGKFRGVVRMDSGAHPRHER